MTLHQVADVWAVFFMTLPYWAAPWLLLIFANWVKRRHQGDTFAEEFISQNADVLRVQRDHPVTMTRQSSHRTTLGGNR